MTDASLVLPAPLAQASPGPVSDTGLDTWPLHQPAMLVRLAADPDGTQAGTLRRLAEVGCLPGETLRVVSRGWLRGGPVAVRVGQATFALRAHEAALLRVRPVPSSQG